MSATRPYAWWERLLRHEEIDGDHLCPVYLHRWTLLSLFGCGVYLHKFTGDDWSTALHDHPKRFISIGLRGQYIEHTPHGEPRLYRAPWIRTFPATHVHRLSGPTPEKPCWTLVIVLWRQREWGFWWEGSWVDWKSFVFGKDAARSKSCP